MLMLFVFSSIKAQVLEVARDAGVPTYTPCDKCAWLYVNTSNGDVYNWNGSAWAKLDTDAQTLSFSDPDLSISGGNSVDLSSLSSSLWTQSGSNIYFNSGSVGMGVSTVEADLHLDLDSIFIDNFYSAGEESRIHWRSQTTDEFAAIGIYSNDAGGISKMRFYTSEIDGSYQYKLGLELSNGGAVFYPVVEMQNGAYSSRATTGANSYFNTSKSAYSVADLGMVATSGGGGVSGIRFGQIQAGANNLARSGIFAEYNNVYGSNMVFQVGRRGDIAYTSNDALRFMEVTETSATSGVSRISFPAASEVVILGGLKDKDSQLGSSGQVLSSTGTGTDWINVGASQLSDLSDVNTSTPTNRNVLVADGVDFESRALVEADISDLGTYVSSFTWGATTGTTLIEDGETIKVKSLDDGLGATLNGNDVELTFDYETATSIGTFPVASDILLLRDAGTGDYMKMFASGFVIPGVEAAAQIVLNGVSAEPAGSEGGLFYDTDDDQVKLYSSATAAWELIPLESETEFGTTTGSTDASGFISINHSFGASPSAIVANAGIGGIPYLCVWSSANATTFTLKIYKNDGTGVCASCGTFTIDYIIKK